MARVRLHSLRLSGFKSFPDEVELAFPGEVSAIIGPNGCGKSNLVDAILWVLGEQSPSLLRLKQMGDVVFSGAAGRAGAGAAEVTLVLGSDDGRWAATDGRLEIRRRVLRSGPSDYRLNGRPARLKDVADELMSVGLGTRDYSIIEQGRVGQVLSARPTDRRTLLEEAAGITRYKARKREAELKLEHTRANLLRLEDVIGEVERSLRQLKRQAKQAERHQRLAGELTERVARLLVLECHALDARRADIARRRGQAQNEVAAAAAALGGAEADLTAARRELETGRGEVEEARVEVSKLLNSRERLEAFLERSADLVDSLRGSGERARQERVGLVSTRATLEEKLVAAVENHRALATELERVATTADEAAAVEKTARVDLERLEGVAAQRRQELLRAISALTDTRNRLGDVEREQDRLAYALGQLDHDRERLAVRRADTDARYTSAVAASRTATATVDALEADRARLAEERASIQELATAARRDSDGLGQGLWDLRHRLAAVEGELSRHGAAAERVRAALPADRLRGQLSDFVHPGAGLAALLDRAWRDRLELPVVDAERLDADVLEGLAEAEGRVRLVLAAGAPPPAPAAETPEDAEDLLRHAGATPADLGWLCRTLPPTWRVADPERARAVADAHPEAIVLDGDGVLHCGRIAEPTTSSASRRGTLELREERTVLTGRIAEATAAVEAVGHRQRELGQRQHEVADRMSHLEAAMLRAEQERARAVAEEQSLAAELGRLDRELEALEKTAERDRAGRDELARRRDKMATEVAALEGRARDLERAVEDGVTDLERSRDAAGEALRRLDRWRADTRLASERAAAARVEAERLTGERTAVDRRLADLTAEEARLATELSTTESEVVRSRTRLAEEQGLLTAARERERRLGEAVTARAARVEKLEREVRQRRETHDREREALHQVEVEQTRLAGEWERLRDQAAAELALAPEELLQRAPGDDDPAALRGQIERLRVEIERLGPVNLLALKEVGELEERAAFLSTQRKDLVESLRTLDQTIAEIDATCTERFVATFEQVNQILAETFSHLFGGGTARLDLVDEDNPLESGIDITAQPPGKKNQSVQLLSGGEKALTALSLLISLFRIKPSPFCILDEVDAPLDDANVERLGDLVRGMTEHTQFVLITHNRRTMQRADVLYGVTMEEPGVSKVVSVRLEG